MNHLPSHPHPQQEQHSQNSIYTYITLGDGDFSYSLDLARYLAASSTQEINTDADVTTTTTKYPPRHQETRLIATGIDTYEDLRKKYRDVDSILHRMKTSQVNNRKQYNSCNDDNDEDELVRKKAKLDSNNERQGEHTFSVFIQHSVNAIVDASNSQLPLNTSATSNDNINHNGYDVVIFNHPHLGTEDAKLHQRFLAHFFHSVNQYWSRKLGGILHLTLAKGQYERWRTLASAQKHGFRLLNRCCFQPPPPPSSLPSSSKDHGVTYYQHRRHQNGKSFAARTTHQSETFTFGRIVDEGLYVALYLPWQKKEKNDCSSKGLSNASNDSNPSKQTKSLKTDNDSNFPCPQCPKTFREKRSLKNHLLFCTAPNESGIPDSSLSEKLTCQQCNPSRTFTTVQALQDHQRAKHNGVFTNIKPDWFCSDVENGAKGSEKQVEKIGKKEHTCTMIPNEKKEQEEERKIKEMKPQKQIIGSCQICDLRFYTEKQKESHDHEFVPRSSLDLGSIHEYSKNTGSSLAHTCSKCQKQFREKRALQQHYNSCVAK